MKTFLEKSQFVIAMIILGLFALLDICRSAYFTTMSLSNIEGRAMSISDMIDIINN